MEKQKEKEGVSSELQALGNQLKEVKATLEVQIAANGNQKTRVCSHS